MNRQALYMRLFIIAIITVVMAACASMGRPEGGPIDETPPVFVRSNPAPGALNVDRNRISIFFDENIQLNEPMNKVVVSPAQKSMPKISSAANRITIDLIDSLIPNTTYTIDFTDAIRDLNEGNELDGFAFDFSTGDVIDTLCISGMVFQAENLEPAQGMLVGVHSNLSDTAITTLPFDRITRTNQLGQFTLRNLKEGSYRIFALNDKNRDNKWDRTEDIAFYDTIITPTVSREDRADTLKTQEGLDSIVTRKVTTYAPNDVLLTWFNENYSAQYLMKYERPQRNKILLQMGAASDTLPRLTIVGGPKDGTLLSDVSVLNASATLDTLEYWITDSAVIMLDSLFMATNYLRTDTLEQLSWTTDTLNFTIRNKKKNEKKAKEEADKKAANEENADSAATKPQPTELLKLKVTTPTTAEIYSPLTIELSEPLRSCDSTAMHVQILDDTLWVELEPPHIYLPDPLHPMSLRADYEWEPGAKYRFAIDSLGITGIYGIANGPFLHEFTVRALNEYSNLTFTISNLQEPAVVQLLNTQDKPVATAKVTNGQAVFRYLLPATYYARLFIDSNENGKYDTGNLLESLHPEEVYYYSKKIPLKKNWDLQQTWDLFDTPVEQQKPTDIKKNKPKAKKGERRQTDEEEDDQYYDEFGNPAVDPDDPFGKRKNSRYNRDTNYSNGAAGYRGATRANGGLLR